MKRNRVAATMLSLSLCSGTFAQVSGGDTDQSDYTNLPIEDLMKVDVTDAFKSPMPLMRVPAAIYVINQEAIHRSGATTLPEALRLVPGVEVARIGSVYYTVSIRGFGNYLASNKILVLLDGRTLYSPYQNTVYWEIEDTVMENIDRIEVIMGPGGSLWGSNAVNGVINIITKHTKDTKGGMIVQSAGDLIRNRSVFQYGGRSSDDSTYRIYGKYGIDHASDNVDGTSAQDGSSLYSLGFRSDTVMAGKASLLLEGEIAQYRITEFQPIPLVTSPYLTTYTNTDSIQTRHLLAKWTREGKEGSQTTIQAYYDLIDYPYTNQGSNAEMYDLQVDERLAKAHGQDVAFGGGFRYMLNGGIPGPSAILMPNQRRDTILNLFGQDIFDLSPRDRLTLGAKLEYNNTVGYEFQPNVRYAHTPNESQTLWAAVGEADRTPSQSELNLFSINAVTPPQGGQPLPVASANIGSPYLRPETVISNEIGFRQKFGERASIDLAAFTNFYKDLIYLMPGASFTTSLFGPPIVVDPSYFRNGDSGQTYGLEVSGDYDVSPKLRTDVSFSALQRSRFVQGSELAAPHYQASWHIAWDPTKRLELDSRLHWYDAIVEMGVPAYVKADLHLVWKMSDSDELSIGGYDLLTSRHYEFGDGSYIIRSFDAEYKRRF
ncbi:MAG: TonB-dependent receptor [Fimbriimonas sp.]|nr:TonB-dependent receptor [Fimbriimonas sp.]